LKYTLVLICIGGMSRTGLPSRDGTYMLVTSSQVKTDAKYLARMLALDEESVYTFL